MTALLKEAMIWVKLMMRVLHSYRRRGRSGGSTVILRKKAASHLAIALHSLQDSFSSGHTKRAEYEDPRHPGAIEDIYIYSKQDSMIMANTIMIRVQRIPCWHALRYMHQQTCFACVPFGFNEVKLSERLEYV